MTAEVPTALHRPSCALLQILQRALDPHSALSVKRSTESAHRLGDAQTPGLWRAQWPLSTANRCISTSALGTAAATIAPDTQASADTDLQSSGTSGIAALSPGMQELLGVLSQPIPLSPRRSQSLNHLAVQVNDSLFIDPAKMLESTIRALYVIKEVRTQTRSQTQTLWKRTHRRMHAQWGLHERLLICVCVLPHAAYAFAGVALYYTIEAHRQRTKHYAFASCVASHVFHATGAAYQRLRVCCQQQPCICTSHAVCGALLLEQQRVVALGALHTRYAQKDT